MKKQEVAKLSIEDLNGQIVDIKYKLVSLKLTHKMSPIENPMRIKSLRKTIARLNTELTKRSTQA